MSDDTAYEDAKAEYEYWLNFWEEIKEEFPVEFKFKYKKGADHPNGDKVSLFDGPADKAPFHG